MSSKNRDFREKYILHSGDTISSGKTNYTITDDVLAYGGSAVIYSAISSEASKENPLKYIIKEIFPNEELFERRAGIIQPRDQTGATNLKWFREHIAEERELGSLCYNGTNLAVPIRYVINPDKITIGNEDFTQGIQDGVFAVIDSMDGKAISFAAMLEYIKQPKSADHPLRNGGCPTLHTTACLIEQVLLTLQAVHNQNVLFGDIHMDNIWFGDCRRELGLIRTALFMDFGCSRKLINRKRTDVIEGRIFSSKGFTPPELLPERWTQGDGTISIQADIFSVGCLMLRCLYPEEYWTHYGKSPVIGSNTLKRDDAKLLGIDDSLRRKTNEILARSMNPDPEKRYPNADAMLKAIQELKRDTEPPKYLLPTNLSSPDFFIPHSRDKELAVLARAVSEGETVFLHGVGGIGKTECAIQLVKRLDPPRGAYLVRFQNSMRDTILNMNFSGYKFEPKQKGLSLEDLEEDEYRERLNILTEYYADTILIVDNFYVDNKTFDELRSEPAYNDFLGLNLKRVFTTRYPVGRKDWEIKELSNEVLLKMMRNYCTDGSVTDEQYLAILKEIQNHTLTAMLIAKTLEEGWGEITPEMILNTLRDSRLSHADYPEVVTDQNRSYAERQIYEHLKALFKVVRLDEDAKRILSYASIFPDDGILVPFLLRLLTVEETKRIKRLVKQGWLYAFERELDEVDAWWYQQLELNPIRRMWRIHPLIREIVCSEVSEYTSYCLEFLEKLKNYYLSVREGEYRWAHEFSDDGEVTNPNYSYVADCYILASKLLPKYESALLRDAGGIYQDLADLRALGCFQRAVELEERHTTSPRLLAECYDSLGEAYGDYRQSSDDKEALEYTQKAVNLMETSGFETSELAKAYHTLAYKYHFVDDQDSFVYWMEKCVNASLACWELHHPRIVSGYKCLAEAYRYKISYYRERILRKKYLEYKKANGGFQFEHQEAEYQSMLSEEYARCVSDAESRLAECEQLISSLEGSKA